MEREATSGYHRLNRPLVRSVQIPSGKCRVIQIRLPDGKGRRMPELSRRQMALALCVGVNLRTKKWNRDSLSAEIDKERDRGAKRPTSIQMELANEWSVPVDPKADRESIGWELWRAWDKTGYALPEEHLPQRPQRRGFGESIKRLVVGVIVIIVLLFVLFITLGLMGVFDT